MPKVSRMIEILLGLFLVASVLVRLLFPQVVDAANFPPQAQAWLQVIAETGYLQGLLYATEGLAGCALLLGRWVPLALVSLAPVTVNIALFHLWLDPRAMRIAIVLFLLGAQLFLCYDHRKAWVHLWRKKLVLKKLQERGPTRALFILTILLGTLFMVTGAAKWVVPAQLSPGDPLIDGMKQTGYLYPLLGATEFFGGLALVLGRIIPLALLVLTPITLNIFFYHCTLKPTGLPIALLIVVIHAGLAIAYLPVYKRLLQPQPSPMN